VSCKVDRGVCELKKAMNIPITIVAQTTTS